MGEFVRGRLDGRFAPDLRAAIWLHRRIDSFTDAHSVHLRSRRRVAAQRRRYAGIIVDMAYDHILATTWDRYHSQSLKSFSERAYAVLDRHAVTTAGHVPQELIRRMRESDWLMGYRELVRIERALGGIARRGSRGNPIARGMLDIQRAMAGLCTDFAEFFPELIEFVETERRSGI